MEITKDLFMKLANKFFADPNKGRVFREYCEDVGIRMDMTVEEMKTKIRSYHKQKIAWSDTIINTLKDVRLPEIEEAIKTLEEKGFELCVSTYTLIFFNKYNTCIFILQISKCGAKFVFD